MIGNGRGGKSVLKRRASRSREKTRKGGRRPRTLPGDETYAEELDEQIEETDELIDRIVHELY